jgi:hypothetical protein
MRTGIALEEALRLFAVVLVVFNNPTLICHGQFGSLPMPSLLLSVLYVMDIDCHCLSKLKGEGGKEEQKKTTAKTVGSFFIFPLRQGLGSAIAQ